MSAPSWMSQASVGLQEAPPRVSFGVASSCTNKRLTCPSRISGKAGPRPLSSCPLKVPPVKGDGQRSVSLAVLLKQPGSLRSTPPGEAGSAGDDHNVPDCRGLSRSPVEQRGVLGPPPRLSWALPTRALNAGVGPHRRGLELHGWVPVAAMVSITEEARGHLPTQPFVQHSGHAVTGTPVLRRGQGTLHKCGSSLCQLVAGPRSSHLCYREKSRNSSRFAQE